MAATEQAKHTPGPWEVGQHPAMSNGWIVRPVLFGTRVMTLPEWDGGHVVLKSEADARLIAAAPPLLADGWALAVMALQSERYGKDAGFRDAVDALLDTCRVARGEPTREQYLAAKAEA